MNKTTKIKEKLKKLEAEYTQGIKTRNQINENLLRIDGAIFILKSLLNESEGDAEKKKIQKKK